MSASGDIMSTSRVFSTSGDTISTSGDIMTKCSVHRGFQHKSKALMNLLPST